MQQIPDAPWIREAEMYGYPPDEPEPVKCPICGEECETIYADMNGDVFGCDRCIMKQDAWDWADEQREADRDDS